MRLSRHPDEWHPEGVRTSANGARRIPVVGAVVAFQRRAWEVVHVRVDDFTGEEPEAAYRPQYRDQFRPFHVTLRRLYGAPHERENSRQETGWSVPASTHLAVFPAYPDGRVPLCSCCQHPWPCLAADQEAYAAQQMKRAEKILALPPGCCPACQEPVSSRQRSITFGGPNVNNPLAEGPTYHLRRKCYSAAAGYEDAWVAAEPGRLRSLLTLRCEGGTLVVHGDGTGECFGAKDSDCPSVYAQHRTQMACYVQSHGCGRGCSREGHPGTRLSGRPDDPRAVLGASSSGLF